jgi:hypothetical protein
VLEHADRTIAREERPLWSDEVSLGNPAVLLRRWCLGPPEVSVSDPAEYPDNRERPVDQHNKPIVFSQGDEKIAYRDETPCGFVLERRWNESALVTGPMRATLGPCFDRLKELADRVQNLAETFVIYCRRA